jgi:putative ABC transport system permease protein
MKEIVAKNQVELGPARCLQLALSGIKFRLFRSLITIAILGLAVAFLSHMLGYSVMSGATERAVWQEMEAERALGVQLRRMEAPDPIAAVLRTLQRQDPHRIVEYRTWAGQDAEAWDKTLEQVDTLMRFTQAVESLSPRHRAILVGDRDEIALVTHLERETAREAFLRRLEQIELPVPLGGREAFEHFVLEEWPALQATLRGIRAGHQHSIQTLEVSLEGRGVFESLIQDPGRIKTATREAGLSVEGIEFERLASYARDIRIQRQMEEALGLLQIRRELSRQMGTTPGNLTQVAVYRWIGGDSGHAEAFEGLMRDAGMADTPSAGDIRRVSANGLHQRRLQGLVPREPDADAAENAFGLDSGSRWLIGLAFMVCVIGVANAMLMSVTERFTEIATMKCLGAMDQFIMMMFVFESAIQGLIGGIAGALLGIFLAWVRGASEYGGTLVAGPVMGTVLLSALLSLVVGILLAVLAAVGPSFTAARLAPMEAMRVE